MITHLKFASIPVSDQQRALEFYTQKLGFRVVTDQQMNEQQRWIELRIGNSQTRIVLFTPEGQEDRIGSFFPGSLACDDVEATYRQLRQRGSLDESGPVASFAERQRLVNKPLYDALEQRYADD